MTAADRIRTHADVAAVLGVQPRTVSTLRYRHGDFPRPGPDGNYDREQLLRWDATRRARAANRWHGPPSGDQAALARMVRQRRAGQSQRTTAAEVGIPQSTYSSVERMTVGTAPTTHTLVAIAKWLGIGVAEALRLTDTPEEGQR